MVVAVDVLAMALFRVACCTFIVVTLCAAWRRHKDSAIPGPWSIPVLGSLPFLGMRLHRSLTNMQHRYGNIFQIYIGSRPVVVLCGLKTVKAALVDQASTFAGRPKLYTFQLASEGKSMVFNSYSGQWKVHRRLAERALRLACNAAPVVMEDVVVKEARAMAAACLLRSRGGTRGVDPEESILWSVAHVKYTLCYGNSHEDADFKSMVDTTLALIGCHNRGNVINFFPWAKWLFYFTYRSTHQICNRMLKLTQRKQEEHLATYDKGRCRDVLDALIHLGVRRSCPLEEDRVMHTVQEYIGAGLDIVYAALTWAVLYLANFPEVQQKVWEEVERVVGRDRCPRASDAQSMTYTNAFILELLRHTSVVPFALPHSTLANTRLEGIYLPKDTFVLINLYSISRDHTLWPQPELFQPERFLQPDSAASLHEKEGFYPFGLGRRRCVGEQLSRMELFLYVVSLLQGASILKPPHVDHYDLQPQFGIVLRPHPYEVLFKPR